MSLPSFLAGLVGFAGAMSVASKMTEGHATTDNHGFYSQGPNEDTRSSP